MKHESPKHSGKISVSDHNHPMHKGPHHDKYIHADCQVSAQNTKGSHELGDSSHLDSVKGSPHGADVSGHSGAMSWTGSK